MWRLAFVVALVLAPGIRAWTPTCQNTVVVPEGVSAIPTNAFQYCAQLESITMPSSVTTIGDHAFFGGRKLSRNPPNPNPTG